LNVVLCVLLAGATLTLFSPVFGHGFVIWDDQDYVTGNIHIRNGWSTIRWAFTSTSYASNWHPLTWLSHALDYQLFGLNAAGHHFHSVLLHALNAALLFLLLAWTTKRTGPSLLVAALFAVHPLNVESVAWVAERKNVLCTSLFLGALLAYVWYVQKQSWRRYVLVAMLFAGGLMAKPMVITLPFVLLLLDYWPLERVRFERAPEGAATSESTSRVGILRLFLEKLPLFVLSAASAWITVVAQRSGFSVRNLQQFSFWVRAENAIVSYALYLWKTIWPARLATLYPHPGNTLSAWQVALSAVILVGITGVVVIFRRRRYLTVGWFWFLGTLVPVIGLMQVGEQAMADRYAYIPLIGLFVMIAWGCADLAEMMKVSTSWRVVPALCVITVLAFVSVRQMSFWESEYSLWAHTAAVTGPNPYAHAVLGAALMNPDEEMTASDLEGLNTEEKQLDEARRQYEEAVRLYRQLAQQNPDAYLPNLASTLGNLGNLARRQNRFDEASQHYSEALLDYRRLEGTNPEPHQVNIATTYNNLGDIYRLESRWDEADQNYEEALKIYRRLAQKNPNPHLLNVALTLNNLAGIERRQNRLEEASQRYEEALTVDRELAQQFPERCLPQMVDMLVNLGFLARAENQPAKAFPYFEEALTIGRQLADQDPDKYLPNLGSRLINLGSFDREQNRMDEARSHYEEGVKIYRQLARQNAQAYSPGLAIALENLGLVERNTRQTDASRGHYNEALNVYQMLARGDPARYGNDVARVEANLRELQQATPAQPNQ
jgi:protein O-mannosyl-transferase